MNTNPLQRMQPYWDARAAGNFIGGGAGASLVVFTCVHAPDAPLARVLVLLGLALVGAGLFCVWLEIGRPWRASNVFIHLRHSWMSRESVAAALLVASGGAFVLGWRGAAWPAAIVALVFLFCQARLLAAARGIPTWRDRATTPLIILTGLAEGTGLFWVVSAWTSTPVALIGPLAALVALRAIAWEIWRNRISATAAREAVRCADRFAPVMRWVGSAAPIALLALAWVAPAFAAALIALAGALVVATGAMFKFALITRMSFQHGYSIPRMPVRGAPRVALH